MKERLDFISPMVPLVNFVQDYFHKVECEASLQLLKLKNVQLLQQQTFELEEEEVSTKQLEIVRWLNCVTEAVMTLQRGRQRSSPGDSQVDLPGTGSDIEMARSATELRMQQASSRGGLGSPAGSGSLPSSQPSAAPRSLSGPVTVGAATFSPGHREAVRSGERTPGQGGSFLQSRSHGAPGKLSPGSAAWSPAALSAPTLPAGSRNLSLLMQSPAASFGGGHSPFEATIASVAQPPAGYEPVVIDGLVLGKGSWASAYRQAIGARREALRLLCVSGIVTSRELGDDLTVVNQEHIDECVHIGLAMLQSRSMDMWAQQPEEAKKVFEARLAALYRRRVEDQQS